MRSLIDYVSNAISRSVHSKHVGMVLSGVTMARVSHEILFF